MWLESDLNAKWPIRFDRSVTQRFRNSQIHCIFTEFLFWFLFCFLFVFCIVLYLQPNTNQKLTCTWPDINWLCEDGGCGCGDCWLVGCVGGDGLNVEFCGVHIYATKKKRKNVQTRTYRQSNKWTNRTPSKKNSTKQKHNTDIDTIWFENTKSLSWHGEPSIFDFSNETPKKWHRD